MHFPHLTPELLVTLIGFVLAGIKYLSERHKLPATVQSVLDKIGMNKIELFIAEAGAMADKTPAQRREYVVVKLLSLCQREGIAIPESFLRMGVEYVFARMKGKF